MAYTEVIITKIADQLISMLALDHVPVEFQCVQESREVEIGNIYLGVVKNIVKNIHGAFVEFDKDEIGFLSMRKRQYKIGDEVLVQVKKEATIEKRPMLSEQIELTGKYLVLTSDKSSIGISNKIHQTERKNELKEMMKAFVTPEYGFIVRTEAMKASEEEIKEEAKILSGRYEELINKRQYRMAPQMVATNYNKLSVLTYDKKPELIDQIVTDQEDIFEGLREKGYETVLCSYEAGDINRRYRIKHYLLEVFKRKLFMKSGGFLYIEQTEAMAVIDVNTGKSIGKKDKEAHIKKINLEAAKEVARQIRLRNLSGIIMVDFIDMKSKEDEKELLQVMQHYLDHDSKKAVAVDITKLGIMEITRKKEKNPIFRQISIDRLE